MPFEGHQRGTDPRENIPTVLDSEVTLESGTVCKVLPQDDGTLNIYRNGLLYNFRQTSGDGPIVTNHSTKEMTNHAKDEVIQTAKLWDQKQEAEEIWAMQKAGTLPPPEDVERPTA